MKNADAQNFTPTYSPLVDDQSSSSRYFSEWFRDEENPAHSLAPALDIEETASEYILEIDLPGVPRDKISVECQNQRITITAERSCESRSDAQRDHRERFYGRYVRSLALPAGIEPDKVRASYEDGVLQVVIPKPNASFTKKIAIGAKSDSRPSTDSFIRSEDKPPESRF